MEQDLKSAPDFNQAVDDRISGIKEAIMELSLEPKSDFDQELDARGLNCPLPILRCKKALAELTGGQVLRALTTDAGSVKDFRAFCKQTGHELLSLEQAEKEYIFYIRKRA